MATTGRDSARSTLPLVSKPLRNVLGILAAVLMAVGAYLYWTGEETTAGVFVRVGAMAGAVWLVAPMIRRPSVATVSFLAGGALLLLRPRLLIVAVAAAVIWRLSSRRRSPKDAQPPKVS